MLRDTLLKGIGAGLALAGSIALAGCVPGGITPDGKHVFFETDSQYSNKDTDHSQDVYERSGGKTTLVSAGQGNRGNDAFDAQFLGVSADGSDVFFSTNEAMTGSDDDASLRDIYRRNGSTTTLISDGDDESPSDAFFEEASADGSRVFFTTGQTMTSDDEDSGAQDVYMRKGSNTTLISDGADGAVSANYADSALNGRAVFIRSQEALTSDDDDPGYSDIFRWRGGEVELISTGPEDAPAEADMGYRRVSADARRVFFYTNAKLVTEDEDGGFGDVYMRKGGDTDLISESPGAFDIDLAATSIDGKTAFLVTAGELTDEDDDGNRVDIYSLEDGDLSLVSQGPVTSDTAHDASLSGVSPNGSRAVFSTTAKLTGNDSDSGASDIYVRKGNETKLVSTGPEASGDPEPATFTGLSDDASAVFFTTDEALTGSDQDSARDVYVRRGSKTIQVSRGKGGTGNGDFDADFAFASRTGSHAFFFTGEALLAADEQPSGECSDEDDPACSGYERFRNKTKLVTRGN